MNRIGDSLQHFGSNKRLISALVQHRVEFVLIGGLAVSWFCPERQAADMDLLVDPTPENAARLAAALSTLRLTGFSESSFAKRGVHAPLKGEFFADILTPKEGGPSYAESAVDAVQAKAFGIPVLVASPSALIVLERETLSSLEAEREKHRSDIKCLEQLSRRGDS